MYQPITFEKNDLDGIKDYLQEEGYVVIKDILTKDEIDKSLSLFKKDWNIVSPNFNFDDPTEWSIKNSPMIFSKGLAVFNGFGQSDFMWSLRTNENIQSIFKLIHQTDDIVTSLDGFSVFFTKEQKSKPWLHIDQNPNNNIYCVQGAYNFFPVNEKSAGFVVIPKSHIKYNPVVNHKKDWIPLNDQEYKQYKNDCVKLLIPSNCLTLWNSRTIHANTGMTDNKVFLDRLTCYISFLPKSYRKECVKDEKIKAYMLG